MVIVRRLGFVLGLMLTAATVRAADDTAVVLRATKLLKVISSNPDSGIPPERLQEARGILIVPHMVEAQVVVGGKRGRGVLLSRDGDGNWGPPEAVEISAINAGAEAGFRVTDLIMICRTQKAVDQLSHQSLTLGFGAILPHHIFGPRSRENRFVGLTSNDNPGREILTYRLHRGLLYGVTLSSEHRWSHALTPSEAMPPADAEVKVTRARGSAPGEKLTPSVDTPEVGRLKKLLTAMTTAPSVPIAEKGTVDQKVGLTNGTKPSGTSASPPR